MFIEQAYKGKNEPWRVILTVIASSGLMIASSVWFMLQSEETKRAAYEAMKQIPNNISLVMNLGLFIFLLGILFFMVYFVHNRSLKTLTTSREKINFKKVFFSFGLIVLLGLIGFAISYGADSSAFEWNFKPVKFIILLIISLILFPFQIGFEEYFFRGYLMQQIGIVTRNKWFPLIFTSVFFGLVHGSNPEVAELGYGTMVFYIGTGLLLGVMTLMDESLELALGFHFGNNFMAAILVSADFAALQTDALFKYTAEIDKAAILSEMIVSILITYPLILFILSKKYKWTGWREKLFGKVNPPKASIESVD